MINNQTHPFGPGGTVHSKGSVSRSDIDRAVAQVYSESDTQAGLTNEALYAQLGQRLQGQLDLFSRTEPLGNKQVRYNKAKRTARWAQQTLKVNGLIENVSRGRWRMTREGRKRLTRPLRGYMLLAFNTALGVGIWGDCRDMAEGLQEDITLCLTSPPYPLHKQRAYGNVAEGEYVDWLCAALEGVIERLCPGGNLVLILGNDIFESKSPARSLYIERLTLALVERFGLSLMDRLIWHNAAKPPGPVHWASIKRCQLNVAYEHVLWFSNDPHQAIADNRRVLQPHTERHKRLLAQGGVSVSRTSADGAYGVRAGQSYANATEGKIPRNVLSYGHTCASQRKYKARAAGLGLPVHGAPAPLELGRFLVNFLSDETGLDVDPMAGSFTFPLAAELEGRRWVASERMGEYTLGGATRFEQFFGFEANTDLRQLLNR